MSFTSKLEAHLRTAAKDVLKYVNVDLLCVLMYFCPFFSNN